MCCDFIWRLVGDWRESERKKITPGLEKKNLHSLKELTYDEEKGLESPVS